MNTKNFKPTRLMIKQHSKTGILYFCKTTKKNFEKYKGSGVEWRSHIKSNGEEFVVNRWVSEVFDDPYEIKDFAESFSELFDIVESEKWANKKIENGLDGGYASGMIVVIDSFGKTHYVRVDDERITSGELRHINDNRVSVIDSSGNRFMVSKDDVRWINHEVTAISKGRIIVKDESGNVFSVNENDERFLNGELRGIMTGDQKQVTCPICGVTGGISNMKRLHFENCGKKPEYRASSRTDFKNNFDRTVYVWKNILTSETIHSIPSEFRKQHPEVPPSNITFLKKFLQDGKVRQRSGWSIIGKE